MSHRTSTIRPTDYSGLSPCLRSAILNSSQETFTLIDDHLPVKLASRRLKFPNERHSNMKVREERLIWSGGWRLGLLSDEDKRLCVCCPSHSKKNVLIRRGADQAGPELIESSAGVCTFWVWLLTQFQQKV